MSKEDVIVPILVSNILYRRRYSMNSNYKLHRWINRHQERPKTCFLLLVYNIHLSLSTDLVDLPPMATIYRKQALTYLVGKELIKE